VSEAQLPPRETLTVEFKSDLKRLSDNDLVAAIVCLANADGGELWLGVEDDGKPTGLHKEHQIQLAGMAGLIAARTSPSVNVNVDALDLDGVPVARIRVPKAHSEVATQGGLYLRRRLKPDGTPECIPMLPHDRLIRASTFGLLDASAQPVAGATLDDLDPLERERLRQSVQRYGGDRVLLELDDEALDGALGLTSRTPEGRVPTLTGLLLVGREPSLRRLVSTHEVAFQVLSQEAVRFNEFSRAPLLKSLEWLETNFRPFNPEDELQVGLFRVPVPKVDLGAFREAVANALIHRDYHRLGAVHVRLQDDALVISNPGGLVEGVTLVNLLVTEPRPRNPALADAMKRIGIVERSGRGVDTIYRGLLRFGRPAPDYSRTDAQSVVLRLPTEDADLAFLKLVVDEENRRQGPLPVDSLIALATLHELKRMTADQLADRIQRDPTTSKRTLEALVETGLVEAHGSTRGRSYTLSASLYQAAGQKAAYTRQMGFSAIQHEQMILNYVAQHSQIKRADVMELCRLNGDQATAVLRRLVERGALIKDGERRGTFYTLAPRI
jgi:ATP-dependent DNA helicase RecG